MNLLHRSVLAVFLSCCAADVSSAQQTGAILGTVTDPTGSAVPDAQVVVTNSATGVSRTVTTNRDGAYQVPQLDIGTYDLNIKASGFKTYAQKAITLTVSQTIRADASLQLGEANQTVTVSAEALQVQTQSNEQSNLITSAQIENLATNGRNVVDLATLGTGVSGALPSFNEPTPLTANYNISFNGQRPQHNIWLVDGAENYDRGGGGGISTSPSQDAIGEFRVMTSNYSADYGFASGGTVSMVLKSGTKAFHGQLWEFFRNDALDANNYIANQSGQPIPKLRYNTWGYNFGGPIFIPGHWNKEKNKLFFFWNQEWRHLIQGTQSATTNIPTPAERSGVFNQKIYVPQTADPAMLAKYGQYGLTAGQPFPTNASGQYVIPQALINPQASALLQAGIFPQPTLITPSGQGQYSAAPAVPIKFHEQIIRMDYNINEKMSLMGHFIDDISNQNFANSIWTGSNVNTVGSTQHSPSYSAVVRFTAMISPSAVNEVTLQYNGNRISISPTGLYSSPNVNIPQYFPGDNLNRLPNINVAGNYGAQYQTSWQPWWNAYNAYSVGDDFTWTKGKHNFKFGGNYMWLAKNQDGFVQTQGSFNFDGTATGLGNATNGNAFADFLLGDANSYSEASAQPRMHTKGRGFGLYALDNWRFTDKLTINLGLRYEGIPQTRVNDNGVSNFYPNLYNYANVPGFLASGALNPYTSTGALAPGFSYVPGTTVPYYSNGLGITGQPGIPRQFVNNHWNNWAPRVGFAYDVNGNGKTVIRAGFGMFYERIQGNDLYNMIGNPPFAVTPTANNVYLSNPSVSYRSGASAALPVFPASLQTLSATDFKLPTAMQWSFNVQQQLARSAVLSIAYVGNEDYHQPDIRNINTTTFGSPYQVAVATGAVPANTNNQPFNIFPGFADDRITEDASTSRYQSLQVGLNIRDMHGLTINLGYTWARAMDYFSQDITGGLSDGRLMDAQNVITNPFNRSIDYGPSDFNRTQVFTIAYIYQFPFFRHSNSALVRTLVGGWQISGITLAQTGLPATIYMPNGNSVGLGTNQTYNRPNLLAPMTYPKTFSQFFNASDLGVPANGVFGSLGRGAITGPGRQNWNMTLFKQFNLGFREGANLEFRADAFNVFNHTQFSGLGTVFGQSTLGQVTSVYDPRVLQLGLTMTF